ncbi:hypothetical protein SNE40_003138 [Patella caerulea]|uniref:Protein YIPF3 n=1 Tax=Patella caerulea TaxID=87958 RepID=A0AAN8QEU4_PATCE
MADQSPWQESSNKMTSSQGSAILDMQLEEMEMMEDDASDNGENGFNEKAMPQKEDNGSAEDMRKRIGQNVGEMVWQVSKQRAQKAWSVYGNIDILRPYFDVEPKEVQKRLIYSLIPQRPTTQRQRVHKELYGPLMVIFTLIALLLFQMKTSDHKVEEGTLMGTAFGVCFIYWFGASGLVWVLSYICGVRIAMLQILSLIGYALFSHCIVLFLGTVIHTSHDHMLFYVTWAVIGGLSTAKMACVVFSRASGKTERIIVIALIAVLHLSFLLYLHFAYHSVVEEISMVLDSKVIPPPIAHEQINQKLERAVDYEKVVPDFTKKVVNMVKPIIPNDTLNKLRPVINDTLKNVIRQAPTMMNKISGHALHMVNKTLEHSETLKVM